MKMKKAVKIVMCILLIVVVYGKFDIESHAEIISKRTWNGFVYTGFPEMPEDTKEDARITILNYKGNKSTLTIPTKIKGMKVVEVTSLSKAKNLKTLHIPNGVNVEYAIGKAPKLKKITVRKNNPMYSVKNNLLLNKKGTVLKAYPGGCTVLKIPNSVKTVSCHGNYKTKLKKIEFGKKVKTIDFNAFAQCNNLEELVIDKNVKILEVGAFSDCDNLKKVVLKKNVTTIRTEAFACCDNLKEVYIYNENCKISNRSNYVFRAIPDGTTIYGKKNSTAEKYAKKFKLEFVEIK